MGSPPHRDWPIVIGGCQRSGTSLVRRILDSHSRIHCGPEVKFFSDFYGRGFPDPMREYRYISTAGTLVDADDLLDVLGRGFVELHERAAVNARKPRWADKIPENVLYWPQWERLLDGRWLLVHVVRNPLDTIASISEVGFFDIPLSLSARIAHYRSYVESALQFAEQHPDRYRPLIYEQLVTDPQESLTGLMSWLGESLEVAQLAFNDQPHQAGLEDRQIDATTTIHDESLHRWPSLFVEEEAAAIWDQTADLWRQVDPEFRFIELPQLSSQLPKKTVPSAGPGQ